MFETRLHVHRRLKTKSLCSQMFENEFPVCKVGFVLVGLFVLKIVFTCFVYDLLGVAVNEVKSPGTVKLSRYRHASAKEESMYISYLFLTSALDGSECSASRLGRPLPPGNEPSVPIV
jgi:hypothetical protein